MNLAALHQKLIAVAKASPPSDKVPYAFEKRILAHIRSAPVPDAWAAWAVSLWRTAVPCILIAVCLGGWALIGSQSPSSGSDLSQQMETTVLAAAAQDQAPDSVE